MRRVYKYPLPIPGLTTVLPVISVLRVDIQDGSPTLWGLTDSDATIVPREFLTVGTGWDVPEGAIPVGTYFLGFGVWHVFELASGGAA